MNATPPPLTSHPTKKKNKKKNKKTQAVREKRYRMASASAAVGEGGDESFQAAVADAAGLEAQNEALREAMDRLAGDFPYLRDSLRRVRDLM